MALSWCFENEATPFTDAVLRRLRLRETYAVTPALWPFEIAAALALAERNGRIATPAAAHFLEVLRQLHIQVDYRPSHWVCHDILRLSRNFRLTGYDAAYLELAMRDGIPLATLDGDLRAAAQRAGVTLVEVPGMPALS
jgi:predicted nucleic acid-binding protein